MARFMVSCSEYQGHPEIFLHASKVGLIHMKNTAHDNIEHPIHIFRARRLKRSAL
jgi:hypothetical protein